MPSLQELSKTHDAMKPDSYMVTYDSLFSSIRDQNLRLLELGVHKGGSVNVWADYFPHATIVGLDINDRPSAFPSDPRVHFVKGSQSDTAALDIVSGFGPFDIIIDDAAHIGRLAKVSYQYLFRDHLKNGGLYILEDWGAALTMPNWPDAKPHSKPIDDGDRFPSFDYGMVGLLKQIVDQMLLKRIDASADDVGKINIQPGLVIIEKKKPGTPSRIEPVLR